MSLGVVLVIEDDAAIRRGLVDALRFHNYTVHEACDGKAGLELALSVDADMVLLDVLMPKLDGLAVLAEVRKVRPGLPVIMLTARGEEHDRVKGLSLGADDYVVKPFSLSELLARVEAVRRRSAERPRTAGRTELAGRRIDLETREVELADGRRASLPEREAEVLGYLLAHRGRPVSRDELLQRVWGLDPRGVQTRTVDMAVARLREALEDERAELVQTLRGRGYLIP